MTREEVKNIVRHVFHFYEVNAENCNWTDMNEACEEIFKALEQEPRKGHWTEEFNDLEGEVRFTCSSCGKYQLFGTDFCYYCGSDNREVVEE